VFILQHYEQVTLCTHTQLIIWGIGPQGYRCQNCDFDVQKKHVYHVEEPCVGPSLDKKKKNRTSLLSLGFSAKPKDQLQLVDAGRKPSSVSPSASMRLPGDLASAGAANTTTVGSPTFRSYTKGLSSEDQVDESAPTSGRGGGSAAPPETRPLPALPPLPGHMNLLNSAALKLGGATAAAGSDLNAGSRSASSASDSWGGGSTASLGQQGEGGGGGLGGGAKVASIKRSESAKDGNKRATPRPYHRYRGRREIRGYWRVVSRPPGRWVAETSRRSR
jgi:hypothetical protein